MTLDAAAGYGGQVVDRLRSQIQARERTANTTVTYHAAKADVLKNAPQGAAALMPLGWIRCACSATWAGASARRHRKTHTGVLPEQRQLRRLQPLNPT